MNVLELMCRKRMKYRFIIDTFFMKDKDLQINRICKVFTSIFLILLLISVNHFCLP